MGNSGWTADPDDITVPPSPNGEPFIYIGPNDPNAEAYDFDASIMFYWMQNPDRAFMLGVSRFGDDGFFALYSFDENKLKQIMEFSHDYDSVPNDDSQLTFGIGESINLITLQARQKITLDLENPDGKVDSRLSLVSIFPETGPTTPDLVAYGTSLSRGYRNRVISAISSAAVAAETVVMSLPAFDYKAGRAYEVKITGQFALSAAANQAIFRIRKTNAAGQLLADYGRSVSTTVNGTALNLANINFTVGAAADVNAVLVLTAQATAGTVQVFAGAGFPRKVEVWDVGDRLYFGTEAELV